MNQILIVEDDKNLNNGIKLALRSEYICLQAFSLEEAGEIYHKNHPDDSSCQGGSPVEDTKMSREQANQFARRAVALGY